MKQETFYFLWRNEHFSESTFPPRLSIINATIKTHVKMVIASMNVIQATTTTTTTSFICMTITKYYSIAKATLIINFLLN